MYPLSKYFLLFALLFVAVTSINIRSLQESKADLFSKVEAAVRKEKADLKDVKACIVSKKIFYG